MRLLVLFLLIFTTACANKNCREVHQAATSSEANRINPPTPSPLEEKPNSKLRVRVFKYDGSLQCEMGSALSVEEMRKDLKGVLVYSTENRADGLMHIQQCGTPTGRANVYEIDRADLEKARAQGFREWLFN